MTERAGRPVTTPFDAPDPAHRDASGRWVSEGRRRLLLVSGTRVEIAGCLGITHQSVCAILAGWTRPSLDVARAIEANR